MVQANRARDLIADLVAHALQNELSKGPERAMTRMEIETEIDRLLKLPAKHI